MSQALRIELRNISKYEFLLFLAGFDTMFLLCDFRFSLKPPLKHTSLRTSLVV